MKNQPPLLEITSKAPFFVRLWVFIKIPFNYIFFGKIIIR